MPQSVRNIVILGSTGSVGKNTLEVIAAASDRFSVVGLSAHQRLEELSAQAAQWHPQWVIATNREHAEQFRWSDLPSSTKVLYGEEGIQQAVSHADVDTVVAAIVGSAGLRGTWAAVEAGKTVALANKETLVMAGPLVMDLARQRGAKILPVDSEHSAVFQAMQNGKRNEIRRIILTASGGPFRRHTQTQLADVTVEQALDHPTWNMGPKITVDSATMMNKALEIIEARWLFDIDAEQIDVVIHPQSIVHSFVEYVDGSVIAQLSPPDMKLPIQYALTYPERIDGPAEKLDFTAAFGLDFEPPDEQRFPAVALGHEVARVGGTAGAVLNAANEAAVQSFLNHEIRFTEIVPACRAVLGNHDFDSNPSLDQLIQLDQWARQEVTRWVCA